MHSLLHIRESLFSGAAITVPRILVSKNAMRDKTMGKHGATGFFADMNVQF
jgi:hypothetical protein